MLSVRGTAPRLRGALGGEILLQLLDRNSPAPAGSTNSRSTEARTTSEQPRACGEHSPSPSCSRILSGTAPRLRGAPVLGGAQVLLRRNSPAPAGSTAARPCGQTPAAEQPRACGEHSNTIELPTGVSGTAPRLRGARAAPAQRARRGRNSPAPAGSTRRSCRWPRTRAEQPRACGEHGPAARWPAAVRGTAPRLRGALAGDECHRHGGRNSPAPAGSTPRDATAAGEPTEQPRACGEHACSSSSALREGGTAPRLRGAPSRPRTACAGPRNSPAPAGSTAETAPSAWISAEQPRACGEHLIPAVIRKLPGGTAPRLRGAQIPRSGREATSRNSPAPAGSTAPPSPEDSTPPEQPRACGEHAQVKITHPLSVGTAPRLRGARAPLRPARALRRNSPAPAGSTTCPPP